MVKGFIEGAISSPDDGFYEDYYFPKEGEDGYQPKRSYTKVFPGFKWVIGTGNYTDDIDKTVAELEAAQNAELKERIVVNTATAVLAIIVAP